MRTARRCLPMSMGLAVAAAVAGCAGSGAGSTTTSAAKRTPVSTTRANVGPAAPPAVHLSVLSPRAGAHTGSTLTVRIADTGAPSDAPQRFRYVLDGRVMRSGPSHLTFHDLASGRHMLQVATVDGTGKASTTFTVRAPAPAVTQAATEAPHTTVATPPPPPPPPVTTTAAPPAKATPSPAGEGIPQGPGAGDGDGDNHGEPSDGDGDI
jgi:hypothetical protein